MHCSRRLIVQTLVFSRSYLHRQVSPPETLVVKGGTTWTRNGRLILPENARLPRNIQGSFTCRKSTTWDKRLYSPSEGRRTEDFFRPGLNPRTWVPKASTLPLGHRSRYRSYISNVLISRRTTVERGFPSAFPFTWRNPYRPTYIHRHFKPPPLCHMEL